MRSAKTSLVFGVLIAVLIALPGCSNPDKNKLLFKPAVGSKRLVTVKQNTTQNIKMAGIGMNQSMTFGNETTFLMNVESLDAEGTATIKVTYEDMKFTLPGMGGGMAMPGMAEADDMIKKLQEGFKGSTFTIQVSRLGELKAIEGAEAVTDKALGAMGGDSDPMSQMGKEMMKGFMGAEVIKAIMYSLFIKAPDKALNPSDTWNDTFNLDVAGTPATTESTYTLRGRADGYVTIDGALTTKVDFANSALAKMAGEMKMSGDLAGTGKGTYSIDEATGWLTHREDKTQMTGKMSMEMPKQLQGMPNMPSKMDMEMDMNVDLVVTNTAQ
ncbi:MAG: hypothetical protein K1Y02_19435 [Candidatus Hydrogenedentes bacterium]|nr:hypothetical protein [Candidatus Hydrogenedentota bacterium]